MGNLLILQLRDGERFVAELAKPKTSLQRQDEDRAKLPTLFVVAVLFLSALPFCLYLLGVDLEHPWQWFRIVQAGSSDLEKNIIAERDAKLHLHSLLEWTAFCIAFGTVVLSMAHYRITNDITTPIIGTAMFFSGALDALSVLATSGITENLATGANEENIEHLNRFIPLTWIISRMFNVCFLIAGLLPFVLKAQSGNQSSKPRKIRFIILAGVLYLLMVYSIIHRIALMQWFELPRMIVETPVASVVVRPWDFMPFGFYLLAGVLIFPRFYRQFPSLFSHGLLISIVPHVMAQLHMAFGASDLYNAHFNSALFLKNVAYAVPLSGLVLDYIRVYRMERTLQATQAKLEVARSVQQQLFPKKSPQIPGFDVAGESRQADVVGGDYFDYIPLDRNNWGIVVADVSGHEIGASLLMAQTRAYLRSLALGNDDLSDISTKLNDLLLEDVADRWFVTMFLVKLFVEEKRFVYTAAGHECYLFTAEAEMKTLTSTSTPLGVQKTEIKSGETIKLEAGDFLLLITDGIVEAASPSGELFGLKRIREFLPTLQSLSAREIVEALFETVDLFRHRMAPTDDETIVVIKCLESGSDSTNPTETTTN